MDSACPPGSPGTHRGSDGPLRSTAGAHAAATSRSRPPPASAPARLPSCWRMLWRLSATLEIRRAASSGEIEQLNPAFNAARISRRPAADCSSTFSIRSTNVPMSAFVGVSGAGPPPGFLVRISAAAATTTASTTSVATTQQNPTARSGSVGLGSANRTIGAGSGTDARRRVRARDEPIAAAPLVHDDVRRAERLELASQLPDEPRELRVRVHRLVAPDGIHQLVVGAEHGDATARGVPLRHEAERACAPEAGRGSRAVQHSSRRRNRPPWAS